MSVLQKVTEALAKVMPDKGPDPLIETWHIVGQPLSRLDGPLKVSGAARFAAEVPLENLAYASLVLSTIAKGRILRIHSDDARRAIGVITVMTHENAPRMHAPPQMFTYRDSAATSNLPVMQDNRVHWNGEPVALVVAESQEAADYAASLIRVEYEPETAALSFDARKPEAKPPKDILGEPPDITVGGAEDALRRSAFRVDQLYRTPRYNHNAIELHATAAKWGSDGTLTVHDASQALAATRDTIAKSFALEPEKVRVMAPFVGGAFGNKCVWNHTFLCIAAAKLTARAVRIVLTREEVFRITGGRTLSEQRVALGANRDGTLAGLIHTGITGVVSHNAFPEQFTFPARHLYAAEHMLIQQKVVELDMVANTSMRAPGESIGTFALESALDELAIECSLDPIELRRRIEPQKDPTRNIPFSSRNLLEAYRRGAERFGWAQRNPAPGSQRDGAWQIGQGVATAYYPYYRMPGGSARLRITADGRAVVQAAAHEMGMGTATVQVQHAAERLALPVERVSFEYGDTHFPDSPVAGGSNQTVSIVAAVTAAVQELVEKLLRLCGKDSPLAGSRAADVGARDGGLYRLDNPTRGESYRAILQRAGRDYLECTAKAPMPAEMKKYSMQSFGAQFCEVRVNEVSGEIRISRWLGSFDTGRILNPKTAGSQFRGGIIMGIGMALTEESFFDERSGRFVNASLAEYHVPVHLDIPQIEVIWNDIPDPQAPLGLHGIGEIGITGTAAAVANAVYNATGKRIRELPITLDKILTAPPTLRRSVATSATPR
ncbi:MAG: dehydrogenase [Gammaproteobacteria bacterium]|jgi:xanthine dehydrogenase YagR molybdenum-binding subunit|nr:dehydrogenase [Gammaproteobacteria bacterium]